MTPNIETVVLENDEISLLDLLQTVGSSMGTIAQLAHQDFKP